MTGQTKEAPARRLTIRASAGTGKTFQLSNRFIMRMREAPVERILATTFTRKAAGEILDRIAIRLAGAVLDDEARTELSGHLGGPELMHDEACLLVMKATRHLHRLRIGTLDSFFSRIATSFALELGLSPNWRIAETTEDERQRDEAIDDVLRNAPEGEVQRLVHLMERGNQRASVHDTIRGAVDSQYDLFLDAPESAWHWHPQGKMLTLDQLEGIVDQLRAVSLSDKRFIKARDKDCERILAGEWPELISSGLCPKVLGDGKYYGKPIPDEMKGAYKLLYDHVRAELTTAWSHQTRATYDLLKRFHEARQELCSRSGSLRFSDITRILAHELPQWQAEDLAHRLDASIDHLLVDEFQDTSLQQWNVLRGFALDITARRETSLFFVGDTKQAIYGWRGGEAAIFDTVENELPGIESKPLDVSRRSSAVIMETVNQVFGGISRHDGLDDYAEPIREWTQAFPRHETALESMPGYACLRTGPVFDDDAAEDEDSPSSFFGFVADYIAERRAEAPGRSIGVLVRKNDAVTELVYELQKRQIPASGEGKSALLDSAAVQCVMSLFTLADHPGDTEARFHIAHSPFAKLLGFEDFADDEAAAALATQIRSEVLANGYGGLLHRWVRQLEPVCGERDRLRLHQLANLADVYDAAPTLRPIDFVQYVEAEKISEAAQSDVRVMTVHQSKGLEFDIVILPELDAQLIRTPSFVTLTESPVTPPLFVAPYHKKEAFDLLPKKFRSSLPQTQARQVKESLCLLYVALTRAVHSLHLLLQAKIPKKPGKLPKTYAGLLRAALTDGQILSENAVMWSHGDERWYEVDGRETKPDATPEKAKPRPPIRLEVPGRMRHRSHLRPSDHEGGEPVRLGPLLTRENAGALIRGTVLHRWCEQIEWAEKGLPAPDVLRALVECDEAPSFDVDTELAAFEAAVSRPDVAAIFSRAAYDDADTLPFADDVVADLTGEPTEIIVHRERSFSVPVDGALLSGTIDRLLLFCRDNKVLAAEIVDFKTDAVTDLAAARKRRETYRGQLEAYSEALATMYGLDRQRIAARLVFLDGGWVLPI